MIILITILMWAKKYYPLMILNEIFITNFKFLLFQIENILQLHFKFGVFIFNLFVLISLLVCISNLLLLTSRMQSISTNTKRVMKQSQRYFFSLDCSVFLDRAKNLFLIIPKCLLRLIGIICMIL